MRDSSLLEQEEQVEDQSSRQVVQEQHSTLEQAVMDISAIEVLSDDPVIGTFNILEETGKPRPHKSRSAANSDSEPSSKAHSSPSSDCRVQTLRK